MPALEIKAFADDHLGDAAGLLAARHARHRAAEPGLSARWSEPAAAGEELTRVWKAPNASGAAAFRDGRLVGYLVGAPRDNPVWGDNVWIEAPGHAVEEAETARDLYGFAAGRWVEEGRPRHYALVPAFDDNVLGAWWRVSFGKQHAHGIREVPADVEPLVPDAFEIRDPDVAEIEALIDIDLALPEHQRESPVFGHGMHSTREESRAEWLETFGRTDEKIFIGATDGGAVAALALVPTDRSSEHRGLLAPDDACFLAFAATLPGSRGSGIGVALTEAALAWAHEQGYRTMITDWRETNLLSSRFWPRRGFRTTFFRLYRSIP
jgi:ribosomal protein S18 acetylase RimI-like enzyme